MMAPQLNLLKDIVEHTDMVLKWGCDDETTPWGFTGQNATNAQLLLHRGRHQAGLHLPRAQLRRRGPRRQVDPDPPQHRRGAAAGHHLHVAQGRHLGQGVRGDPRRRHGQGRRLRPRRGRRRPQDPGVGLQEDRDPGVDDQGAWRASSPSNDLDPPLLRRLDGPRPVLARARPARVHPSRHAGPRRPRRAPVADHVLRHAARRGPRRTSATSTRP